jgi:hypothetical protein
MASTITDARVREACKGLGIDVETASPDERFRAYCRWTGQVNLAELNGQWASVLIDVLRGCGFRVR